MFDFLSYEKFEFFLSNFSFITLFGSMIAYWIQTSGIFTTKLVTYVVPSNPSVTPSLVVSETPSLTKEKRLKSFDEGHAVKEIFSRKHSLSVGFLGMRFANFSLLTLLIVRWIESGHFPLSNLYESLMFLAWSLTFFHLILEKMTANTLPWLGAIISPTALLTNAFANFSLPSEMQHSAALVPALQSNWLMMHVTVMILSYAALICGSLLSIGFLILTWSVSSTQYDDFVQKEKLSSSVANQFQKLNWAFRLDNLSYRMLGIGFPFLTIGILSGAVWANEAWGSYWSWDPKETWALLTWLVFAIYLHIRLTKNWQGKKPAIIASFGFVIIWICYLGVNLLGEGLHSYGWLQN